MKKPVIKTFLLFSFLGLIGVSSCSDELDILTGAESVPVVYCVIDVRDSVYKVLLTKTFAGDRSAYEMAKDPDVISFKNAKITMEAWKSSYPIWSTEFIPVSDTRDSGIFASDAGCSFASMEVMGDFFGQPFYESTPDRWFEYLRIVIDYGDQSNSTYARINSNLDHPSITFPVRGYNTFNICDTVPYRIQFYSSQKLFYDLGCTFRYSEESNDVTSKSIDFSICSNIPVQTGPTTYLINQSLFFKRLAQSIPDSDDVVQRKFISLDLRLFVASQPMKVFMDTYFSDNENGYQLWNCFHNGIGLFALKTSSVLDNLKLDQRSLDTLASGSYTRDLKFIKW
ncbi:MAG: hypothetical protein PHN30_05120 [Bacteroidales bacterium]|jgi:hypothetical protein|nr:hypothetical protein [Bacteroidales bacterium]MDD3385077.1 hypothetical protein [Bacteroidales bacterium]MDD3812523.1 hypothetical protein [Bacteroidales bacterium]MDD3872232.1 hypothetical protein [Bacteroidales bacterium]MDD4811985.1 hypothetical protein [Bacteroidales bacterium]